jgi:sugar phosphate isomerase/epimerase
MTKGWTRRDLLRSGVAAGAALTASGALGCGGLESRAPEFPPLRLSYGGFAMGIQSFTLRHYTLWAALDVVQALGLAHVELIPATKLGPIAFGEHLPLDASAAEIDAALDACRARGIAISAHGVNSVPDAAAARALFAFAERARIPLLTIMPSVEALPALDALCAVHPGVRLAIHNHGPHLPWETIEEIEGALRGKHPSFGACVDTGHYIRSGIDPAEAIRRFGARVHGVHLKDFVSAGALADGCILGQGLLKLGAVFAALRDVKFAGALSLEHEEHAENVVPDVVACLEAASAASERSAAV